MNPFAWTDCHTEKEALAQLGPKALVKAGGIDVLDRLKDGIDAPERLVNIRDIQGWNQIEETADGLRIGPLVTLAQLDSSPLLHRRYAALAQAAGHAATPQIRNVATVGGNILQRPRCWYFRSDQFKCLKKGGDHCFAIPGENQYHAIFDNRVCAIVHPSAAATALVALDSSIDLTSSKGRRTVKLEQFFVDPEQDVTRENAIAADELLTAVIVPAPATNMRSAYLKLGEKESFDWPLAEVAVVLEMNGERCSKASIVMGAAAPAPHRATAAEAALAGKLIDETSSRAAASAAIQGATPLSQNGYKLPLFAAAVRRTILAAAKGAIA